MKKPSFAFTALLAFGSSALFAAPASEIWTTQCAKCHGTDGAGKSAVGKKLKVKDYTDAAVQTALTDEDLAKAIKQGVTDNGKERMKAFTDLTPEDVTSLVAHIRTLKK